MAEASLIPKKVAVPGESAASSFGVFFVIALVFFILSAGATGGLFLYKGMLQSTLTKDQETLKTLESQFPVDTIQQHEEVGTAIAASKKLLNGHLKQSQVFKFLEDSTLPAITYASFAFTEGDRKIILSGEAPSYQAVAQQSSIFESVDKVSSATFSNLSLSAKGTVGFSLTILLKGSFQ